MFLSMKRKFSSALLTALLTLSLILTVYLGQQVTTHLIFWLLHLKVAFYVEPLAPCHCIHLIQPAPGTRIPVQVARLYLTIPVQVARLYQQYQKASRLDSYLGQLEGVMADTEKLQVL